MVDDFDVRTLPFNFVSKSQPSKIIERLNQKRKEAHNAALEYMNNRKTEANTDIDEEIRHRSRMLVTKLYDAKQGVEKTLIELKSKEENELILEELKFERFTSKIYETNEARKKFVDELVDRLADLEKNRLTKFKEILRETYDKMSTIYHKLPFELEELFENEIMEINKISMNNYQKHSELQVELKLQIENDTRMWTQELYEIREHVKVVLKEIARKRLIQEKIRLRRELAQQRAEMMGMDFYDYEALEGEHDMTGPPDPSSPVVLREVERWIENIRGTLAALDMSAKYIVHFYKETIVVLFSRFFEEMKEIRKELISSGYVNEEDIEVFQREIYTPTAQELKLECHRDFEHLQNVWNNTIESMKETLDETYRCLKTANGLWENHFRRIEDLQQLVLRNVKVAVQKNSLSSEKTELKLSVAMDMTRQAPTEQKLTKCMADVKKLLDVIEKTYYANATTEITMIKKYKVMMETEIDVLMAEIERFLTLHPPDEDSDPKKQRGRASQSNLREEDSDEALIPQQMLFCRYQVDAVNNWMFGLWEGLNQYLSFGREEILAVADYWIDFESKRVLKRLEVRLSFHAPRFERMKCILYEKRREELIAHAVRFDMHKLAMEERVKGVKAKQKENEEKYNEISKNFVDAADKYEAKVLSSRCVYQIQRYKGEMRYLIKNTTKALDDILEANDNVNKNIMDDLKVANFKYMSVIRLFSENGNYTAEELKVLLKNLTKLEKATGKSLQALAKEDRSKYNKCSAKISAEDGDVSSAMDEIAEEHKHNENTENEVKELHADIRLEVVGLRTNMKQLYISFKELVVDTTQTLGDHTYLEQFSERLQEVVSRVSSQSMFLVHPEPVVMYTPMKSLSSLSRGVFANYASTIFSEKLNFQDDNFLSKLVGNLLTSLQDIQASAKSFYTLHNCLLLDSSQIQPTYDDFMDEVTQKYRGFLIQCEICWAENVDEFLNLLNDFIEFKDNYLSRFENEMQTTCRGRCTKVEEDIIMYLKDDRENIKGKYKEVHQKLKAMHGHPKNRQLLDEIQMEFADLVVEIDGKLEGIEEPYIKTLVEEYENVKILYEETKEVLDVLNQDYGLTGLRTLLTDQLTKKVELMHEMVGDEQAEQAEQDSLKLDSSASGNFDVPTSVSKQVLNYMKTTTIAVRHKSDTLTSNSASTMERSEVDFLVTMEENREDAINKIMDFVATELVGYHENFQRIWPNEIRNILSLYTVKYDPKMETMMSNYPK